MRTINIVGADLSLTRLPCRRFLEPLFEMARDPLVTRHLEWQPHRSIQDTAAFFEVCQNDFASGRALHCAIVRTMADEVVGVASLLWDRTERDTIEATRWLGSRYWGGGIGRTVLSALLEYAFGRLGARKLFLTNAPANVAAQRSIAALSIPREVDRAAWAGGELGEVRFSISREQYLATCPRVLLKIDAEEEQGNAHFDS